MINSFVVCVTDKKFSSVIETSVIPDKQDE